MALVDKCFILQRFPSPDSSLIVKCYFQKLGKRTLFVPEYFYFQRFKVGIFEPFNVVEIHAESGGDLLTAIDTSECRCYSLKIAKNFPRFIFLSKLSKTVLKFVKEPEVEIFKLLESSLEIEGYFGFNFIRFLINLSSILGFSPQNLKKPGWINLITLSSCRKAEIKNHYCIFLNPEEFAVLKKVSILQTRPFSIRKKTTEGLERFFYRFLEFQNQNF